MKRLVSATHQLWQSVSQDTVVAGIGNPDEARRVNGDPRCEPDLIRTHAEVSPRAYKIAVLREFDHAIPLGVRNEHMLVFTHCDEGFVLEGLSEPCIDVPLVEGEV